MKYTFHPDSRDELYQTVDYYEKRQANLGIDFLEEVYSTIQRIIEFPEAFTIQSKSTQRCFMNRFPFAVIYQIKIDEIFVVAIAHCSRKPGYWKIRL